MVKNGKRAVSKYERRRWLDELEQGKGITDIAKRAGRDIRIVKRNIDIAQEERLISHVRQEFLKGRLEQHYDDLFREIQRLKLILGVFPPVDLLPVDATQLKFHKALRDHIKRTDLNNHLERYGQMIDEFREERKRIESKLVQKEKVIFRKLSIGGVLSNWSKIIIEAVESGVPLSSLSEQPYNQEKTTDGKYEVLWQASRLILTPVTKVEASTIMDAHSQLTTVSTKLLSNIQQYRQLITEAGKEIAEELDTLIMKRLLPGHCDYCPF